MMVSGAPLGEGAETAAWNSNYELPKKETHVRTLAITGGKGGVGKSNIAVNLAYELGSLGNRLALLDADFGLANADLICGVSPKCHLGHVFSGEKELEDIFIKLSETVDLIPGGNGIEELANISFAGQNYVFGKLKALEQDLDFLLIDTAAGIAGNVLGVLLSASEVVVVVTPDPASIVDAYATIKIVLRNAPTKPIWVLVNSVGSLGDAEQIFNQLKTAVDCFLNQSIKLLGIVPNDAAVREAVREQTPVVRYAPEAPASRAIRLIAKQLNKQKKDKSHNPIQPESFWDALAGS
jgi:flagellar biosynthesis protein FlhG